MDKDWLFASNEYICDLRAVGVLLRSNKLLVQRERNGNEFALPGGHVRIGETLENGLIREYKEEMDADIACKRLLWSEESFWQWHGRQAHSIAFYYLVEPCEESAMPDNDEFIPQKDNTDVLVGWMPIDKLQDIAIYPRFLSKEIFDLNGAPKHFVSQD